MYVLVNIDNTVGSVGFCTRIAPSLYPVNLIKVDEFTGLPIRDRYGMCIMCQPGQKLAIMILFRNCYWRELMILAGARGGGADL